MMSGFSTNAATILQELKQKTNPLRAQSLEMVAENFETDANDCGYICNGYVLCSRFGRFAKPSLFFIIFILLGVVHGAVETLLMKTILSDDPVIQFNVTKWIVFGSEILQLITALPIIFWGSRGRRPQWLASSVGFLAVTGFIFASYLLSEYYGASSRHKEYRTQKDPLLCNIWYDNIILKKWSWYWLTVLALFLLHFATGISRIAYWSLGITYVDDNSLPQSSPFVMGLVLALKQFGPFSGLFIYYFSTSHFYNGLCWLGVSIIVLIVAFLLGMFPAKLIVTERDSLRNSSYSNDDSGYFSSLKRILTNKVIILNGSAMIFVLTFIVNASAIEKEYVESVFYVPSSSYSLFSSIFSFKYLFSILKPTMAAFAILTTGFFIHRIRPRSTFLSVWSVICLCIAAGCMFSLIFLRCSGTPMHRDFSRNDLLEYCNKDCGCSHTPFTPVCSEHDQFVFYSPCHAGCSSSQGSGEDRVFLDCQCVSSHTVRGGRCTRGKCTVYYWLYQLMTLIVTATISSGFVGSLVICLRSVLSSDKSIMIGTIALLSGFAARAPFKFLYDFVMNMGCIYLVEGLCKMYNSEKINTYFHLLNICFLLIAAGILSLMCFLSEDIPLYESMSVSRAPRNKPNVSEPDEDGREMTDFRAQLSQALKNRREIASEEQQLLGERRSSMSSRQFNEQNEQTSASHHQQQQEPLQRASQAYENGRNSIILSDEKPDFDMLRSSSSSNQSSNRDFRPKVLPKPILISKPSTSTFKPEKRVSTSSSGISLPSTPSGTSIKAERCLTTPL